jgi:acyl-coenzyme A thioesterase PaaI-like protein
MWMAAQISHDQGNESQHGRPATCRSSAVLRDSVGGSGIGRCAQMKDTPLPSGPIPSRLNVSSRVGHGELCLRHTPIPQTCRLGSVRASVLGFLVDSLAGIAVESSDEHWTFTSELSVRMAAIPAPSFVEGAATIIRSGSRSATCEVRLCDENDNSVSFGIASFTFIPRRATDPVKRTFSTESDPAIWSRFSPIEAPLTEAAGIQVVDAHSGVVEVEIGDHLRNPAGAVQGAMVALIAEAAAEVIISSRRNEEPLVTALDIRYLRQARTGPIRTRCRWIVGDGDESVVVELFDVSTGELLTHALAHSPRTIGTNVMSRKSSGAERADTSRNSPVPAS